MAVKSSAPALRVGDRVSIRHTAGTRGRVVEFRGPLGPGGAFVYRIRIIGRPKPTYAEVLEEQLTPLPTPPKLVPAPAATPVLESPKLPAARPRGAKLRPPRLKPKAG